MQHRKVDSLVQALGLSGISKRQISQLCQELDERVQAFFTRPLTGEWIYVWLDATYVKVREGGRTIAKAVIIATGVDREGRRKCSGSQRPWRDPRSHASADSTTSCPHAALKRLTPASAARVSASAGCQS